MIRSSRSLLRSSPRIFSMPLSTAATSHSASQTATFPSLILGPHQSLTPIGSFAENQAEFLQPDAASVDHLTELLQTTPTGIVAHYYMDVELQGVLTAVAQRVPHRVAIADSLAMGDAALRMVQDHGAEAIACLGVDFMSESVQAIVRQYTTGVPVYRLAKAKIGCSLAESAEREAYQAWLQSAGPNALHVVYINTSLETKAVSNTNVPTITCTSSNVLNTLLTADAQIPELESIYYGPDTYMGDNLVTLLGTLSTTWSDAEIRDRLHPAHSRDSLRRLLDKIHVYPHGNCVVHHMFGAAVVDTVRTHYADAYVTAHLEVPGEMFEIAMEYSLMMNDDDGPRGVVGSTSDILKFIARTVESSSSSSERLRFILGTEAGMVTSILQKVQPILDQQQRQVEIIFPVASEAVMATSDDALPLVPGVAGGEGCSTAGGCATCPFMKMNSLDALTEVLQNIRDGNTATLVDHLPPNKLGSAEWNGRPAMNWATEPIRYMRSLTHDKELPKDLVERIVAGGNR